MAYAGCMMHEHGMFFFYMFKQLRPRLWQRIKIRMKDFGRFGAFDSRALCCGGKDGGMKEWAGLQRALDAQAFTP